LVTLKQITKYMKHTKKHTKKHTLPPNALECLITGLVVVLVTIVLVTIVPAFLAFWLLSLVGAPDFVRWPASVAAGLWAFLNTAID
jgi:hypothetical protein